MIVVNSKVLLEGLKKVSGAVGNKVMPILSSVRVKSKEGKILLETTDLNFSISALVEVESTTELDFTVNFKKFSSVIGSLNNDTVNISIDDNDTISIKCNKSKFKLSGMGSSEWPQISEITDFQTVNIDVKHFSRMVNSVYYSASTDTARPVLNGILFDFSDNNIKTVCTDGRRMSVFSSDIDSSVKCKSIVPIKAVIEIIKNFDSEITIQVSESTIVFKSESITASLKLIEGNYPDYSKLIPDSKNNVISINRYSIYQAINRVSTILDDAGSSIKLNFESGNLKVCASNANEAIESLDVESSEAVEFTVNPSYLIDVLKNVDDTEIKLSYTLPTSPISISSDSLIYIIMPMRG